MVSLLSYTDNATSLLLYIPFFTHPRIALALLAIMVQNEDGRGQDYPVLLIFSTIVHWLAHHRLNWLSSPHYSPFPNPDHTHLMSQKRSCPENIYQSLFLYSFWCLQAVAHVRLDSPEMSLCYANRSAALFHLGQFEVSTRSDTFLDKPAAIPFEN